MEQMQVTLTVCFEEPFWIGVCECVSKDGIQAKKVIFGAEPQMQEILQMVQQKWYQNIQFGKCISISKKEVIHKIQNAYKDKSKNRQNCAVLVQKHNRLCRQNEKHKKASKNKSAKHKKKKHKNKNF